MKNKNLIRFVQSLIFLPVMTMTLPFGNAYNTGINSGISQNVLAKQINITSFGMLAINQAVDPEVEILKAKVQKAEFIDAYFKERDMPLEGTGAKMVEEAEKNNLDWRLLPAIAIRESTGGKFDCKKVSNNAFGWGSCKISFKSNEEAIEVVAKNLGGNNPNTAHHYDNKTLKQILQAYNPPSVVPRYAQQVMSIMNAIGEADEIVIPNLTT
ncbi:glucosaminidase domain-containing protein [Patescibacteria group bacterium]|nr:glucosaminidase domain-containing protein [Patescibacteria group bacterium]